MLHDTQTHPAKRVNYQSGRNTSFELIGKVYNFYQIYKGKLARHNSRRQLLKLEPHQLKDIGITRQQALEEANRPFWD